jgi:hypothetical protein
VTQTLYIVTRADLPLVEQVKAVARVSANLCVGRPDYYRASEEYERREWYRAGETVVCAVADEKAIDRLSEKIHRMRGKHGLDGPQLAETFRGAELLAMAMMGNGAAELCAGLPLAGADVVPAEEARCWHCDRSWR